MIAFVAGCKTPSETCDARGDSDTCEIHHRIMETEIVKNKKWNMPSQEYLAARARGFRHSYPFLLPEQCKKWAVYICADCVRAEEEWKQTHPGQ